MVKDDGMTADMLKSGEPWRDAAGELLQAHGGGVLHHGGTSYWFGQDLGGPTAHFSGLGGDVARVDVIGVRCYASEDLLAWRDLGLALPAVSEAGHDLHPSGVAERPKVLHNARSGQFVMWLHIDRPDYLGARAGVAVAAAPQGPYRYLGSVRPGGFESRDLTLFQDEDGAAYLVFASSEEESPNHTLRLARLSEDYLSIKEVVGALHVGEYREAPVLFRHQNTYHLVTSGCTGWAPNAALHATARDLRGPWTARGNPCVGPGAGETFGAQGTFAFALPGAPDTFVFMLDFWQPHDLGRSGYAWLPLTLHRVDGEDGEDARLEWREGWPCSERTA